MARSLLSPALVAATLFARGAFGQAPTPQPAPMGPPQISVSASGEAKVVPDRATIQIAVQTRATTSSAAGSANARIQRAVLDTLRRLGLTEQQLATVDYSMQPEFKYDPNGGGRPQVIGYVVSNTIRADLPRIELVGQVIDASLSKGATNIASLEFYSSQADAARHSALAMAVTRARADADAMAHAAGGTLGPLLELSAFAANPGPRPMFAAAAMKSAADATPITPGQQTIEATISARWQFLPGAR